MSSAIPIARAAKLPMSARIFPAMVVVGSAGAVVAYVRGQLKAESQAMDRFFSKYNSTESEASRQRSFDGAVEDPRKSLYNILGW